MAVVVLTSAREVAWACRLDTGMFGPPEVTLPQDLQSVPKPRADGDRNWLHR